MRWLAALPLVVGLSLAGNADARAGLHDVVKSGDRAALEALLPHKKIDKADKQGNTALHYAAAAADAGLVELLLSHGANPNGLNKRYKTSALHELARSTARSPAGMRASFTALTEHGADLWISDAHGETPLAAAARNGNAVVVDAILAAGPVEDSALEGALLLAREHSRYAVIRLLQTRGVQSDVGRDEALLIAAAGGDFAVVDNLVRGGAEIDTVDETGRTALINAAANGHRAVATFLLDRGANVDAQTSDGETALHFAAARGDVELIEELLARDADINAASGIAGTPLNAAAKRERVTIVNRLLAHGAVPAHVDQSAENLFGSGLATLMHADFHAQTAPAELTAERRIAAATLLQQANEGFAAELEEAEKQRKRKRRAEAISDAFAVAVATAAVAGLEHMRQESIRANQRQTAQIMALSGAQSHDDYFRRVTIYENAMIDPQYNQPFQVDFSNTSLVNRDSITGLDVAISEYQRRMALTQKLIEGTGVAAPTDTERAQ